MKYPKSPPGHEPSLAYSVRPPMLPSECSFYRPRRYIRGHSPAIVTEVSNYRSALNLPPYNDFERLNRLAALSPGWNSVCFYLGQAIIHISRNATHEYRHSAGKVS